MPSEKRDLPDLEPISNLNPTIHAPSRLMILAFLAAVESADFTFLLTQTGLTRGNLSTHVGKLEESGYVEVKKEFVSRIPRTLYKLTPAGISAIETYRENMKAVIENILG